MNPWREFDRTTATSDSSPTSILPLEPDDPVDARRVLYLYKENSVYNRRFMQRQKMKRLLGREHRSLSEDAVKHSPTLPSPCVEPGSRPRRSMCAPLTRLLLGGAWHSVGGIESSADACSKGTNARTLEVEVEEGFFLF
jgi:hypothetical protein